MNAEEMGLERSGDGWRLRFEEVYATSPEDLWSAVTRPDRLVRWMARYELDADGGWRVVQDGEAWGSGTVTACDPPNGFTTTWQAEGEAPTVLTVRLDPVDGGTRMVLVHDGIAVPSYGAGWAAYLGMLADHVDDPARTDLGAAGFRGRYEALRQAYGLRFAG